MDASASASANGLAWIAARLHHALQSIATTTV
jgi:hypothetical protein